MKFCAICAALFLSGASQVLAIFFLNPRVGSTIALRSPKGGGGKGGFALKKKKERKAANPPLKNELTCGVAGDAITSDCDKLLSSDFSLEYDNTCSYKLGSDRAKAYRPACSGNCCIYTTHDDLSIEQVKKYTKELLECRSTEKGMVNGRIPVPKGFLCVADQRGCGDCL
ncbi:hypothetical protein BD779DRAFT_1469967 [Infundibulicybe gibba]|nr:hypothetical protein BD779DRAFT_1469967 [Infundibulicybe gibba]